MLKLLIINVLIVFRVFSVRYVDMKLVLHAMLSKYTTPSLDMKPHQKSAQDNL